MGIANFQPDCMTKISLVIITLNEEHNIARCIQATQGIVDEIIVLDSGSTDNTVKLASQLAALCYFKKWTGYASQKDYANSLASHPYILSLDADEVLSDKLRASILALKSDLKSAYELNRLTNYCGHWVKYSSWYPDKKVRLFPKNKARWDGAIVHEELLLDADLKVESLQGDLLHYSYNSTFEHRLRADKYSRLTAQKLFSAGIKASVLKPVLSAVGRWLKMYVFRLGFLDGWAGFKIAGISAISNHYKYLELRRLWKFKSTKSPNHIAISRTDSIGDVILTLPMCGIIKKAWPDTKITFIGKTYTEAVIRACKNVDEFLNVDEILAMEPALRQEVVENIKLDVIIHVFPNATLARLASKVGVPIRIGAAKRLIHWTTCNFKPWFSRKNSALHEAQLNLKLLKPLHLQYAADLSELAMDCGFESRVPLAQQFQQFTNDGRFKLVIHPKSRGSAVEWSLASYSALIEALPQELFAVFITGTAVERELISDHGLPWKKPNVHDLTGKLNLDELITFIASCDALLAASTGPLHIASACGINAIGLYSPKRPMHAGRWAPIGKRATFFVAKSHPAEGASLDISVAQVLEKLLDLQVGKNKYKEKK